MIFTYLFIISIVGIIILLALEHKKTKKTLLQILKSSCSIDSVKFEKHLGDVQQKTYTFKKNIYSMTHFSFKKVIEYNEIILKKLKYHIRKKLHSDKTEKVPSEFIIKISSK